MIFAFFTSCSKDEGEFFYGKFGKQYFFYFISSDKKKLIQVDIPEYIILSWGKETSLSSSIDSLYSFVGYPKSGLLTGSIENKVFLDSILGAFCKQNNITDNPDAEDRLEAMVSNANLLRKKTTLDRMKEISGKDIEKILEIMDKYKPETEYYNIGKFFQEGMDLLQIKRYFGIWLKTVIGG